MKRDILKLVLLIITALGLFTLYLLICFPLLNTTVFRWEKNRGGQEIESQSPGSKNSGENISDGGNNITIISNDGSVGGSIIANGSSNSINNKSNGGADDSADISKGKNGILTFDFENPVNPEISDYILISITAKNSGLAKYPYGSIAINLSEEKIDPLNSAAPGSEVDSVRDGEIDSVKDDKALGENIAADSDAEINSTTSPGTYKIQERARIFVDGIRHNYYIAVGENKYWRYDWNLDGPTLKGQIGNLEIEIPEIEGVDIQLNGVSLNQRPVFAADSHINYLFKDYFQLSYIDRYLTPAYIFLILFTIGFFPFSFFLKRTRSRDEGTKTNDLESVYLNSLDLKDRNSRIKAAKANNIYTCNLNSNIRRNIRSAPKSNELTGTRISFKTLALLIPLLLLIFFSFYFISNYIFTVKGYWDSYKQYIMSGRLDETYYGFSDFEKFVTWVGEKVPQGQNVIVLVKGEPVYIMAQMAYGLYPRDIKFVNISSMSSEEITDRITSYNSVYKFIVVLSETDKEFLKSVKVKLEYSYRENAGFIYKLIGSDHHYKDR